MLKDRIVKYKKLREEEKAAEKEKNTKYRNITSQIFENSDIRLFDIACINYSIVQSEMTLFNKMLNYTVSYCPYYYEGKKCDSIACRFCKSNHEYVDAYNKYKEANLRKWKAFAEIFTKTI